MLAVGASVPQAMCTCLSDQRKLVLVTYFNGDWHSPQPVHYHAPGCMCGADTPEAAAAFQAHVVQAIMPKMVPLFPRHRWVGAPQTLDELLLLCFLHDLYRQVVPVWLQCLRCRRNPTPADFATLDRVVVGADVSSDLDLGRRGVASTAVAAWDDFDELSEVWGAAQISLP